MNTKEFYDYQNYGYGVVYQNGFFIGNEWYDLTIVWHNGGIPGYSADLFYFPDLDFGFISLVNADAERVADEETEVVECWEGQTSVGCK